MKVILTTALLACVLAGAARAEAPAPTPVTPELIAAAQKEGSVVFYSSYDVAVGEVFRKGFETKYPGIAVRVERAGSERIFSRVAQEYESGIHAADVVDSADATHLLFWKRKNLLAQYVPEGIDKWPSDMRDPDGYYAADRASLTVIGYNTKLVKPEDAPKRYADLLDAKWKGKIVKAHPAYSGNIMTTTYALSRLLGWGFYEKLATQRVLQVQSSTEPPKKVALGERPVMIDGNEYNLFLLKKQGAPIEVVYAEEGTTLCPGMAGIMKDAPHPNAARLFASFLFSLEAQQLEYDVAEVRSFHPEVKDKPGRIPLGQIKLLKVDPAELEKETESIRAKYAGYFGT
ncbi:MAG TPA: extracellular solute-binding protein [Stellaceae bacterium]|jgi:iron(III) transport system substrate-binding protein|nr:extracellular solute-binding protein [Stellaceae bacterium]